MSRNPEKSNVNYQSLAGNVKYINVKYIHVKLNRNYIGDIQ